MDSVSVDSRRAVITVITAAVFQICPSSQRELLMASLRTVSSPPADQTLMLTWNSLWCLFLKHGEGLTQTPSLLPCVLPCVKLSQRGRLSFPSPEVHVDVADVIFQWYRGWRVNAWTTESKKCYQCEESFFFQVLDKKHSFMWKITVRNGGFSVSIWNLSLSPSVTTTQRTHIVTHISEWRF